MLVYVMLAVLTNNLGFAQANSTEFSLDPVDIDKYFQQNTHKNTTNIAGGFGIPADEEISTCALPGGTNGQCLPFHRCDVASWERNKNMSWVDVRCPDKIRACCQPKLTDSMQTLPEPVAFRCGYSNPGAFVIRSGQPGFADYGEFPSVVAILRKHSVAGKSPYHCSGSIIHPSAVLTSAHKIDTTEAGDIKVRAGEWDTQTQDEEYPYQERDVRKLIKHEEFYRPLVLNSIALLFLEKPFELKGAPHMGVACLGHTLPQPGTRCFTTGWGKEGFQDPGAESVVLRKVEVPVVLRSDCQNILRGTRLGSYFVLHGSFLCAGGEVTGNRCLADAGAPLMCPIGDKKDSRFVQYGAGAWGIGCENHVPGAYVNIPRFREWIVERIREENLNPSSFEYQ